MGTLQEQPPRNYHTVSSDDVKDFLTDALKLSKELKVDISVVLEAYRIKELQRRNTLYVSNGDILDEQLAGFGELLSEICEAITQLSVSSED